MALLTSGMWSNFKLWTCMVGLVAVVTAQQTQTEEVWATGQASLYRVGQEFQVNTFISGDQRFPSVAFLRTEYEDEFVVTWETLKFSYGIAAGVFNMYGSWSGEFDVKYSNDAPGYVPSITTFGTSGYVITWGGCLTWNGNTTNVHAQMYYDFTSQLGSEFIVNNRTSRGQTCPVVAGSSSGFVVVWTNKIDAIYKDQLYAQRFNSTGQRFEDEIDIISDYTYLHYPSVEINSVGGIVTTVGQEPWTDSRGIEGRYLQNGFTSELYYIFSSDALFSSVTSLSSGGYVVVWQEYSTDTGKRKVRGTLLDDGFYPVVYTFDISTYNYYQAVNNSRFTDGRDVCRVIGLDSGGFIVVWATDVNSGTGFDVYGQVFDNQANRIGEEFRINSYISYDQFYPSIAVTSSGLFVVVWQSQYQDGSGYGVYGQMFQLGPGSESGSSTEISVTLAIVVLAIVIPVMVIAAYLLYLCRSGAPAGELKV